MSALPELETVDLLGVEILATGGPIYARGSQPGGDHYDREDLRRIAAANADLADELKPAAKISHAGDAPAVGWLSDIRINAAGDRLLADIRNVPKRFAGLVKARAYRTRSVELKAITSQTTGRRYELAVTGLAWLGGKMPAVHGLADVERLYEQDVEIEQLKREIVAAGTVDPMAEQRETFGSDVVDDFLERDLAARLGVPRDQLL